MMYTESYPILTKKEWNKLTMEILSKMQNESIERVNLIMTKDRYLIVQYSDAHSIAHRFAMDEPKDTT